MSVIAARSVRRSLHCVQNGLWDDLTETDELMSTAMSFSGTQLSAKTAAGRAVKKTAEPQSVSSALTSSASTTCRSYHSKGCCSDDH